ncbi:AsmA family protein [Neptunomonas antarctica]|uniref:AsmA protein n=1 Tax=Neptunomonas antarctica TaxID=619304 RepID=A0A1N7IXE9_9GAMM|nr:AsmA family protein [Neptunomonas antarctica]SIS41760.1 AsmA protein [Neptunomonas antarctica]
MGKLIKVILGLVVVCVVLIVAGGAILTAFFDPNDYKPEIEQAALKQGGIELNIGGEISWSVFPRLGLTVNNIDARFPDQDSLAHLDLAQISVRIPELLSGNVKMSSIIIEGLKLNLTKNKAGQINWQTNALTDTSAAASLKEAIKESAPTDNTAESDTPSPSNVQIDIESVQIISGAVNYTDEQTQQNYQLTDINLETGRITNNQLFPFSLNLNAKQHQNGKQLMEAAAQLEGQLLLDLAKQQYQLKGFSGELNIQNDTSLQVLFKTDASIDLIARQLMLDNWQADIANLKLNGKLLISNLDTLDMSGTVTAAPFALNPLLATLGQAAVETADPKALKNIGFISTFSGTADLIKTSTLSITLDDTVFDGSASVNLKNSRIALKLAGNSINLDRYLPPETKQSSAAATSDTDSKTTTATTSAERYSKQEIIPIKPLQSLNLAAAVTLKTASYQKIKMSNIDFSVDANNGIVKVERINLDMYGGKVRNSVTLDARKKPLKITTNKAVSGLQIGKLLTDMTGEASLTGTLSTQSTMVTYGQSVHSIVNNMNGSANITVTDGVVNGINMAQELCQTINNLSATGSAQPAQTVDQSTPFAKMGGNFTVKNGIVSNNDLSVQLDAMNIKGSGAVDLPKATVDYQLALIIQENLFKKTCPVNNRLEGVEWPVRCKGSFDLEPTQLCKPDARAIRDILKNAITSKVKEELSKKVQEKLGDKLKEQLGGDDAVKGLLKGLFN